MEAKYYAYQMSNENSLAIVFKNPFALIHIKLFPLLNIKYRCNLFTTNIYSTYLIKKPKNSLHII